MTKDRLFCERCKAEAGVCRAHAAAAVQKTLTRCGALRSKTRVKKIVANMINHTMK